jgi:succinate dehydrogenase / fumarate reductase iron-sulfur subunit/antitoxin CptB
MKFMDSANSGLSAVNCKQETVNYKRMMWRARRGLLELDIVLGRFIEAQYADLTEAEMLVFDGFLDGADNPLWDMISGMKEAETAEQQALLEKIRAA